MTTQKYCLALDLKDDPQLMAEYKAYYQGGLARNSKKHKRFGN